MRSRRRRAWLLSTALATMLGMLPAASASASSYGVAAWGYNGSGQLGNGTSTISRVPGAVAGLSEVTAVAAGGEHGLALLANGTVRAWGNNRMGQLGNGTTTNGKVPLPVSGLSNVVAVAAGKEHSTALLANGTVMAWGGNEEGQLGGGTKALKSTVPVAVKGLSGVTAIAAGGDFNLARLSNGTVMAWGAGGEGQLGNGKKSKSSTPVVVKGLSGVTAIAAGGEHGLALLSDGTVMSWGSNLARQLGMPSEFKVVKEDEEEFLEEEEEPENSDVPGAVQALSGAIAVAAGAEHSLALLGDGEVMAWGANSNGQLGNGSQAAASNMPTAVGGLGGVTAIAAGARHNLALLSGGSVEAWGYNPDGQLGDGSNLNSPVAVAIAGLGGVVKIAGGGWHSLSMGAPVATVTGISPASGPHQGGTSVAITGLNFAEATSVHFGSSAASAFTVNSPTSITATSSGGEGTVDITVTTPSDTSGISAADRFTFIPPPTVTKVKPNNGPAAGGTSSTITGTDFTGATSVSFGALPANSFTVKSPTSITAIAPAGTAGAIDITVTTASGTSAVNTYDVFKYAAPTITSISPSAGPSAGGTSVTVNGSGFAPGAGATSFLFGKATGGSVLCSSSTSCTFVTPPAKKAGVVEIVAAVGKAKSAKIPPGDQFTYE
ncbi:MAG: IPT/TIG domain-containing protein [Solirubrobacterales bacterium]